jgi:hypothetical protein
VGRAGDVFTGASCGFGVANFTIFYTADPQRVENCALKIRKRISEIIFGLAA